MTTLRILAKGDYLSEIADIRGISIASSSRIVHTVCDAICRRLHNIKFPTDPTQQRDSKEKFYKICKFPNVLGAIDGTLIPIQGMAGVDEPNYVCRKQFHAINVQAIADADLSGGSLQFNPPKSCKMIGACFRLNNKALKEGIPVPDGENQLQIQHHQHILQQDQPNEGNRIRAQLIQRF
ncbi:HARBI1 [Mytilus coruscus]|uniref:HARBI1 n=1 Tax=Mytilus coruscus TaxID=42192 RepID=A0A6J8BIJ8_MYTCO|nr:HARBI1 [Mytilus coruscus]